MNARDSRRSGSRGVMFPARLEEIVMFCVSVEQFFEGYVFGGSAGDSGCYFFVSGRPESCYFCVSKSIDVYGDRSMRVLITLPWGQRLGGAEAMLQTVLDGASENEHELELVFFESGPWPAELSKAGFRV